MLTNFGNTTFTTQLQFVGKENTSKYAQKYSLKLISSRFCYKQNV